MALPELMNPVLDAEDVAGLARFYCALLGLHPRDPSPDSDWVTLLHPDGSRALSIQHTADHRPTTWPEPGVPQQMHLDLHVDDRAALDAEHERVVGLGATMRLDRSDDPDEPLRAYADPAGHIFCLMTDAPSAAVASGNRSEWQQLLTAPRHANEALRRAEIPQGPGVYSWFQDGDCVYVGKASNLRSRLSTHRSRSLDLSRSTLRASVAVRELGVTRAHARSRPTRMTREQIDVVDGWFRHADVAWLECETPEEAAALERRLRATRMPALNRA